MAALENRPDRCAWISRGGLAHLTTEGSVPRSVGADGGATTGRYVIMLLGAGFARNRSSPLRTALHPTPRRCEQD